ncbi:hypothetical protein DF185_01410 [Marinifilum breve]|uniref:Calx-beta domain-containing protein n=2 Tax=Marinifilum breve TaxID=2184082 RepID=A0A2V4A2L9_9BACT|nr:hypothetical protein DF185_01410 [Marinifilum breve]
MVAAILVASCSSDDDPVIPKLSITAEVAEISETATSALIVKVNADAPTEVAYSVGVKLTGSAVEGVNFQEIARTVTIGANKTSANIFVTPINVTAIEANKNLIIELQPGTAYDLDTPSDVNITIVDNANPPSDAPEVSFSTSNIITNPYMEEVKTITVGLSKTFATDLVIPLTIDGDLVEDTDFEIAGLINNEITIPAGTYGADFTVTMKYTGNVGMDKTATFGFAIPSVTDYAVKATENSVSLNAVDPQVDFSAWFNTTNKYNYYFAGGSANPDPRNSNIEGYRVRSYYFNTTDNDYASMSSSNYFAKNENDENQWKEVINTYKKEIGYSRVNIAEQERYEIQNGGDLFALRKFFPRLAKYGQQLITTEKGWVRFVTVDADATQGTAIIPEQTITLYNLQDGLEMTSWTESIEKDVEGVTEKYSFWYEDSRNTQGDLSQSAYVTPAEVQIHKSVGTYNLTTGEVFVDLKFTCTDPSFTKDDTNEKYILKQEGDTYTIQLRFNYYKEHTN